MAEDIPLIVTTITNNEMLLIQYICESDITSTKALVERFGEKVKMSLLRLNTVGILGMEGNCWRISTS
jgi:hypothetical protein